MRLTARDKKLLFLLGIFCIVVLGGQFLIIEPLKQQKVLEEHLMQLENQKLEMMYEIAQRNTLLEQIDTLQTDIKEKQTIMRQQVVKENIDAYLTGILLSHNLTPVSLNFGELKGEYVVELVTDLQFRGGVEDVLKLINQLKQLPDSVLQDIKLKSDEEVATHSLRLTFYMMSSRVVAELDKE